MTQCIGNDPTCPCQDGDLCHYVDGPDTKAWPRLSLVGFDALSPTQQKILAQLAKGKRRSEIEQALSYSYSHIKNEMTEMYRRLGLNRTQAVVFYLLHESLGNDAAERYRKQFGR